MSKYSELHGHDLNGLFCKEINGPQFEWIEEDNGSDRLWLLNRDEVYAYFDAVNDWDECCHVLDALLAITTGINLKSDGTATTEINGKQESAGGGHCRAICELYLMAKDAETGNDR